MRKSQSGKIYNPITKTYHYKWLSLHKAVYKELKQLDVYRGGYGEIGGWGANIQCSGATLSGIKIYGNQIVKFFLPALEEEYVDFDKRGRGSALNHDLYGYDPKQGVAVIQARQAIGNKYGIRTRKTYFLVGKNEITGEFFRHPVSAGAVHGAINKDSDPVYIVKKIQLWMWQVTEKQLAASVRQGDILLVPERSIPKIVTSGTTLTIAESHQIKADEIRVNGRCFAKNPTVTHTKGQHASVALTGWCSVRVARETYAWDFASRIGD